MINIFNKQLETIDNTNDYILDPLSTIIKLIIVSYKPINCKISIKKNIIDIQESNLVQPLFRYFKGDNRQDLHYLSSPIENACAYFLDPKNIDCLDSIKVLFKQVCEGLKKLIKTYSNSHITVHCLRFYEYIVEYHLESETSMDKKIPIPKLLSLNDYEEQEKIKCLYHQLNKRWTKERLKIIIELVIFLEKQPENTYEDYLDCLEKLMVPFDKDTQTLINKYFS